MTTVEKLVYLVNQNVITIEQVAEQYKTEVVQMINGSKSTTEGV